MSERIADVFDLQVTEDDGDYSPIALLAIINTLSHEGGYVWDEHDTGGETKYGISKRSYPDLNIKALSLNDAVKIYYNDYWKPSGASRLKSAVLACLFFDMCVNAGISRATKLLQKACDANEDGILGKNTARACNEDEAIVHEFTKERESYYFRISHKGNNKRFLNGWLKRCHNFDGILNAQWQLRDLLDLDLVYKDSEDIGGIPEADLRSRAITTRVLGHIERKTVHHKNIDTLSVSHIS